MVENQTTERTNEQEAEAQADALNSNLLASQQERDIASLQEKNRTLTAKCVEEEALNASLQNEVSEVKNQVTAKATALANATEQVESEVKSRQKAEEREKDVCERMARVDVESDSLRQEISRLQTSNVALNAQITELQSSSTLSSSSSAPLKFENTRLRTEIESLNAHCKWLEGELSTRTAQTAEFKTSNTKALHDLRNQLSASNTERDELSSEVASLKLQNESIRRRMESSQRELLDNEQNHADAVHELNVELQAERRLVSLSKENILRLEERYNDVVREMGSMKALAADAEQQRSEEFLAIKAEAEQEFNKVLEEAELNHQKQIEEFQGKLDEARAEKAELEDEFMSAGGTKALTAGNQMLQLTNVPDDGDGEPLTLTKLYEKVADAQDETRKERAQKKRLELILERIQNDIERDSSKQRNERKEFELAMEQNQEMHSRLNEAWEECNIVRRDLQQTEREFSSTSRECQELRLENSDMAKQVQMLLQKSLGGEDGAAELQSQNQRMMQEHHRMSTSIAELQEKIDSDVVQQKLQELEQMKEERSNQAMLVKNIVQQRDLYRALLVKNDASLLTEYGADGAIVAAKDQIEKFTEVEKENQGLLDSNARLKAELSSITNEKVGLEERLARSDAYSNDLSITNNKIQAELLASNSATARIKAEAEFHSSKVARLQETVDIMREDLQQSNESKNTLQRLCDDLQGALSLSKDQQSKLEEQLRQGTVQVRLAETNCNAMKDAEIRLNSENNSLRSELARHIALQESMQKIEATLSKQGDDEQHRLQAEAKALSDSLSSLKEQHSLQLEKLQNELADAELRAQHSDKQKEQSLVELIAVKDQLSATNATMKTMTDEIASLEKDLNAAKIKLGDSDVDTSDQERIENLANELAEARANLVSSEKKIADYKKIAEASEKTLVDATAASEVFKKLTVEKMRKMKEELKVATESGSAKEEALQELSKNLSTSRAEQEKVLEDLRANIDTLKTELESSKANQATSDSHRLNTLEELNIYKAEARAAKDNYERELALHADARKELQRIRQNAEEESRVKKNMQSQIDSFKTEFDSEKQSWDEARKRLEEAQKHAETRLAESQEQNKILHSQLDAFSASLEKQRADMINAVVTDGTEEVSTDTVLSKQISELREVVRLMRMEKDAIETQLESARRTAERERAAAEIAKKSLYSLRDEIELLQKEKSESSLGSVDSSKVMASKLKQAEDQLLLLRESNTLLRVETEKTSKSLEASKKEADEIKSNIEPIQEKCRSLEVENAALDSEKASLIREVDAWKDRVQGLLKKFNQIDPEEHANALKKVEETSKLCDELRKEKENLQKEITNVKVIVTKLNKELSKQRSLVASSKAALSKSEVEKKALSEKTASTDTVKKEVEVWKKAKEKVDTELKSTKLEHKSQTQRLDNLKRILNMNKKKASEMQSTIEELKQKEKEAQISLAAEKKLHETALKELANVQAKVGPQKADEVMASTSEGKEDKKESAPESKTPDLPPKMTSKINPQVPKVPPEGFQFVASNAESKEIQLAKKSKPSIPDNALKQQPKASPATGAEKVNTENLSSQKVPKSTQASSNIDTPKKLLKTNDTKEKNEAKDIVSIKDTEKVKKSTSLKPTPAIPISKEGSLREKLLKKKRALEQKIAFPPAKRPAPSSATLKKQAKPVSVEPSKVPTQAGVESKTKTASVPSETTNPSQPASSSTKSIAKSKEIETGGAIDPPKERVITGAAKVSKTEKLSVSESETDKEKPTASEVPQTEIATEDAHAAKSVPLNPTAKPFMLFGSGKDIPTFGQPKNPPEGLGTGNMFSKESNQPESSSETKKEPSESSNSGGAFLNLKPPGSGSGTPLIFGSSNIKLPTPSKDPLPLGQQPFGTFKAQPFGSSLFAPVSKAPAAALFGSISSKKRSLDTNEDEENASASKLTKVEEEAAGKNDKAEETTNDETKI